MKSIALRTLLVLLLLGAHGCGDCAGLGAPAVAVKIVDAQTQLPVASGATLYLLESGTGVRVDSVTSTTDIEEVRAGWDLRGTFDIVVEKAGYFPWTMNHVVVDGDCTVKTRFLTATLRKR